ncbi:acetyl-CoA hydrolase/transferase C-terminal domain-containing protein [Ferroplasma sp.]|uniref:acetyl-CoA hydrolase/transferase C-terminal domain-containing protein n=1 Tax=Ferroplasma sp. TaxID=2591003 RepID=UPI00260AD122|nr:acetyl-CoA hydrolase/transferase C-terminal domain-containing protein [Ferroplasma sp.]
MRVTKDLENKVMSPEEALKKHMKNIGSIAFGGMGGQSVPKVIPTAMSENSEYFPGMTIYTGGGTTKTFEKNMSGLQIIRRFYYLSDANSRLAVNSGKTMMMDYGVSKYSQLLYSGSRNSIDVAVIEATAIEKGGVILSLSVDVIPELVNASRKVIIEINRKKPNLKGLHDIYRKKENVILQLRNVHKKIGTPTLKINSRKIGAIVYSDQDEESASSYGKTPSETKPLSENIWRVLAEKIRFNEKMPLQVGAGSIASSLIDASPFENLKIWCEISPSRWLNYTDSKIGSISASAIYSIPGEESYTTKFLENYREYSGKIILRPNNITNSPELISRLGVIVVQQAIEIDIFGSVNVSHINGNIYNGVGGSIDFCSAGKYVIVVFTSTVDNGKKSRIIPLLTCVDIPRHLVDFVVTEIGIADLRWKDPRERAVEIINKCAHPDFRDSLLKYFNSLNSMHMPSNIDRVIKWFGNQ